MTTTVTEEIKKQHGALKTSHAKMDEQIKELEAKLAKESKAAKRPSLALGQVWKHKSGSLYLSVYTPESGLYIDLVCISGVGVDVTGKYYSVGNGFAGHQSDFTYLGEASDLLTIKEPTK